MAKRVPIGVDTIDIETVDRYPQNSLLVLQSVPPWNLKDLGKFPEDTLVLFWNLHPENLYPYIFSELNMTSRKGKLARLLRPLSALRYRKLSRFVGYLAERNALHFMDGENYSRTKYYFPNAKIVRSYIPVFSDVPTFLSNHDLTGPLRCTWIGRIADFKTPILLHLMHRLDALPQEIGPIVLNIVGDGDKREQVTDLERSLHNLKCQLFGELSMHEIDAILLHQTDILFAMGTSALEGASRRIPTFLLDYSYGQISGLYRFKLITETVDFSLGRLITTMSFESASTLETKLAEVIENYDAYSDQCYEHWKTDFSPDSAVQSFLKAATKTSATVGELRTNGFDRPDIVSTVSKRLVSFLSGKTKMRTHGFEDT